MGNFKELRYDVPVRSEPADDDYKQDEDELDICTDKQSKIEFYRNGKRKKWYCNKIGKKNQCMKEDAKVDKPKFLWQHCPLTCRSALLATGSDILTETAKGARTPCRLPGPGEIPPPPTPKMCSTTDESTCSADEECYWMNGKPKCKCDGSDEGDSILDEGTCSDKGCEWKTSKGKCKQGYEPCDNILDESTCWSTSANCKWGVSNGIPGCKEGPSHCKNLEEATCNMTDLCEWQEDKCKEVNPCKDVDEDPCKAMSQHCYWHYGNSNCKQQP